MTAATVVVGQAQTTSLWSDIRNTLRSLFATIVAVARSTEKAALVAEKVVGLADLEVENLSTMQKIRLDFTKQERIDQAKLLAKD